MEPVSLEGGPTDESDQIPFQPWSGGRLRTAAGTVL